MNPGQNSATSLGHRVELAEFRLLQPDAAVPEHVREAWQRFLEQYQPGDEIWTFDRSFDQAAITQDPSARRGWAGFALLRHGQVVARFEF